MTTRFAVRLLALTAGLALAAGAASADPRDDKKPEKPKDIKEIMKKGHAGKKALLNVVGNELKAEKWDKVQEATEQFKVFGESIGDFDPPKGEKDSWKKFTEKYKEQTKKMDEAADKKDAAGTEKYMKEIQGSCKGCHSAHKP